MQKDTAKEPRNRRILARGVIWVALFAVIFAGFKASGLEAARAAMREEARAASAQALALSEGATLGMSGSVSGVPQVGLLSAETGGCRDKKSCTVNLANQYQGREMELLPAYRWKNPANLSDTYGVSDVTRQVTSSFAELLFLAAGWVWSLLLGIVAIGLRMDPLFSNSVGQRVNALFFGLSQGISAGFVWFACVASVMVAIIAPLRGRGAPSIISVIIGVAVPLGALWAMTTAADPNSIESRSGVAVPVGSPVWLGRQGVSMLDDVTGFASDQMSGALNGVIVNDTTGIGATTQLTPSCTAYTQALHTAFTQAWETDVKRVNTDEAARTAGKLDGKDVGTQELGYTSVGGKNGAGTLISLSTLWESSFMPQWVAAEFGGTRPGYRVYCHYLDRGAGITAPEQATIGVIAGYPAFSGRTLDDIGVSTGKVDRAPVSNGVKPAGSSAAPTVTYNPNGGYTYNPAFKDPSRGAYASSDQETNWKLKQNGLGQLLMWAACTTDGNGKFAPGEAWAANLPGDASSACQTWWNTGDSKGALAFSEDTAKEMKTVACPPPVAGKVATDCSFEIGRLVMATHGKNSSARFVGGALALVGAVAYLWVLGMMSFGLIIAKIGFILMLMLLPLTLFLLAIPKWRVDPKRAQRNATGLKLLKRTMGFAAASTVFQFAIILLILTISLVRAILVVLPAGDGLVDIAAPLIALYLFKKLSQTAGLGNIASPSGALGLGAAAAAGLAGGGMASARARAQKNQGLDKLGNKILDKDGNPVGGDFMKAARMAKHAANAPKNAIDKAKRMPEELKKAGSKAGEKLNNALEKLAKVPGAVAGAPGGVKSWAKDMASAAKSAAVSVGAGLTGAGAGAALAGVAGGAAGFAAGKANAECQEAQTPQALAAAQASVAGGLTTLSGSGQAIASGAGAVDAALAAGSTAASVAANRAAIAGAIAAGTASGNSPAGVLAEERAITDGARAINQAAMDISNASGGTISPDQARQAIFDGTMAGFVQKSDGSLVGVGEALQTGLAGFDASGNLVPIGAGTSLHKTDGGGAGPLAACAEAASAARVHNPLFGAAGAGAAAAATAGALGVSNVGAVRGTGGVVVPVATPGGVAGGAFDMGSLGSSAAATPLAFTSDSAARIADAVGGDASAAAAVWSEVLALKGCQGASLDAVADYAASSTYGQAALQDVMNAAPGADQAAAWDTFRENYGLHVTDAELAHCVAAAGASMASYHASDLAVLQQPLDVAKDRAMASVALANAEMAKDHPNQSVVASHLATAHAYQCVAEAAQNDIAVYAASGGNVIPTGSATNLDLGAIIAQKTAEYSTDLQNLDFVGRHTSTYGVPDASAVDRAVRSNGGQIASVISAGVASFGAAPAVASPLMFGTPSVNSTFPAPRTSPRPRPGVRVP